MTFWEIRCYMKGIKRRYREGWYQSRWLGWIMQAVQGGKIQRAEDMIEFPWEKQKTKAEQEEDNEQLQALIEQCRKENEERATNK